MKTTPVSFRNYNSTAQKQNQPAFKGVYLMGLKKPEIKGLYEDGKNIWKILEEVMPLLQKKFDSFFDAGIGVHPNVLRTINIKVTTDSNKVNELKNYVIQNNEKKFQFPQKVIESLKGADNTPNKGWLDPNYHVPVAFEYDKLGYEKSREKLMKFVDETDTDTLIRNMYKECPPDFAVHKNIPSYYWEFPGG